MEPGRGFLYGQPGARTYKIGIVGPRCADVTVEDVERAVHALVTQVADLHQHKPLAATTRMVELVVCYRDGYGPCEVAAGAWATSRGGRPRSWGACGPWPSLALRSSCQIQCGRTDTWRSAAICADS